LTGHGETDTAAKYGLVAADRGYSFDYDGDVWWLFGDTMATATFGNGTPNKSTRYPYDSPLGYTNDSIAKSTPTGPSSECPPLEFVQRADGAYSDPSVVPDPRPSGYPASTIGQVSLRTNESPIAGIGVGDKMYVVFGTDDPKDRDGAPTAAEIATGNDGAVTRSVMAVETSPGSAQFTGLYTLSGPSVQYGGGAKFVNVAIESAADGYVYVWGTEGNDAQQSAPYLLRLQPADIATGAGIEYFHGLDSHGAPVFEPGESNANPLFKDHPLCMGQFGVQFNPYLERWLMLYNCRDNTTAQPNGIWMRTAPDPWGPWSKPQTIFDPDPDTTAHTGFCFFIHSNAKAPPDNCPAKPPADDPLETNPPSPHAPRGSYYGPYFVAGWTTGVAATSTSQAKTTIYYTLDTYDPYGQLILQSTIDGPVPVVTKGVRPCVATGAGKTCG
jgi:Domain of unknown function (DUF4185)